MKTGLQEPYDRRMNSHTIETLLYQRGIKLEHYGSGTLGAATRSLQVTSGLWNAFDALADIRHDLLGDGCQIAGCSQRQRELLRWLGTHQIVDLRGNHARVDNDISRQFLAGRWLEDLVAALASETGADEVRVSQCISWTSSFGGTQHSNEMDVVLRKADHMAFISCKAMRPETLDTPAGPGRLFSAILEARYWAEHFGGASTLAALVTTADFYDEGQGTFRDPALAERAKVLNVRVITGDVGNVLSLKSSIAHLIRMMGVG